MSRRRQAPIIPADDAPEAAPEAVSLRQRILDFLGHADYQPIPPTALRAALKLGQPEEAALQEALRELQDESLVVDLRHKGLSLASSADLLMGRITFTRSGAAFVASADGERECFIPPGASGTAFPGDRVLARLGSRKAGNRARAGDLAEGEVIRVLERRSLTFVGTLKQMRRLYYVKPMRASFQRDVVVPDAGGAQVGDRVLVRLTQWDEPEVSPEGEIIEVIGQADNPAFDTLSVIKSYDLPTEFPEPVLAEAEAASIRDDELKYRLDLREGFVFTVDPATARDFDDAISLENKRDGTWRLGVHIADVSYFVRPGSELDREARARGTSVYLPDQVLPMLPEQLSNGLCSLVPHKDRLTFSVFMTINAAGEVIKREFAESVINSRYRLTYEQAMAAIQLPAGAALPEAGLPADAVTVVKEVNRLAQVLRARRHEQGALFMELPEVRISIGPDGRIQDLIPSVNDESHQMIEECMLLANEAVSEELSARGRQQIFRIHEEPDPEKLAELEGTLFAAGIETGDLAQRLNLSRLLNHVAQLPAAHAWSSAILRSLKRALYSTTGSGHFGLAKQFYTHFTSPIRRYPDLVIHRLLKACIHGAKPPFARTQLVQLADHCSEREQLASEAERETVDLKRLRFFSEQLTSGQPREFEAVVSEVRNFGVFVYLPKVDAYGLIHVSQLANDFFDFDPVKKRLVGRRQGVVFSLGCELNVIIAKVDGDRRMLDFAMVPGSLRAPQGVERDGLGAPPPPSPKGQGKGGKPANREHAAGAGKGHKTEHGPAGKGRKGGQSQGGQSQGGSSGQGGRPAGGRGRGRRPGGPAVPAPGRKKRR